jgi:hypothetical protein
VTYKVSRLELSLQNLSKALKTNKILESSMKRKVFSKKREKKELCSEYHPGSSKSSVNFPPNPESVWKSLEFSKEPAAFSPNLRRRERGFYKTLSSEKTGIKFHQRSLNTMKVLFETYHCLILHYQLCRYVYNLHEFKTAKRFGARIQALIGQWPEVFGKSVVTKSILKVNSVTLRIQSSELCTAHRSLTSVR